MTLRIGHLSTFYHTAVLLMADERTEERLGANTEWRLFGTGPEIVKAFERGELDIAYIGLPPAIIGISRGAGIRCIAGGHIEGTVVVGGIESICYPEENDLGAILSQFRGHKVGVPGKGSIHDVIASDCLDRYGLSAEVEIVNFRWADQITDAMAKVEVSCAFGTPALAVAVRRYSGGKLLWPASKLWPHNPSYGIVASRRFIEDRGDIARQFLVLHEEASSLLRDNPEEAAKRIAEVVGIVGPDYVAETLSISPRYCAQLTDEYLQCTMKFVEALLRLGYINERLSVDEVFDLSAIRATHPQGSHY